VSPATPRDPGVRVRAKMPAPFARPCISVGGPEDGVTRVWRSVVARNLGVGDLIPGVGKVHHVHETVLAPQHDSGLSAESIVERILWTVTVHGGNNNTARYRGDEMVWCFTSAT